MKECWIGLRHMKLSKFKNSIWISVIAGIIFGALCALLDLDSSENIWTFSSLSGSLGFWAITGMIILMQYENRFKSALGIFVYFAVMNSTFFLVHFLISPLFRFPRVSDFVTVITSSLGWLIPSGICGILTLIAYNAKKDNIWGTITLTFPLALLTYEGVCLLATVIVLHKYLFQTIVDFAGAALLFYLYSKGKNKVLLIGITVAIAAVFLLIEYLRYGDIMFV